MRRTIAGAKFNACRVATAWNKGDTALGDYDLHLMAQWVLSDGERSAQCLRDHVPSEHAKRSFGIVCHAEMRAPL